jgi:hypothetical protein
LKRPMSASTGKRQASGAMARTQGGGSRRQRSHRPGAADGLAHMRQAKPIHGRSARHGAQIPACPAGAPHNSQGHRGKRRQ